MGRCPGWTESSLGAQSLCWFCHVATQITFWSLSLNQIQERESAYPWCFHDQMVDYPLWLRLHYVHVHWLWVHLTSSFWLGMQPHWSHEMKNTRYTIMTIDTIYNTSEIMKIGRIYEPRHDKTNKMSVRSAKTQISLGIRPVWSESSLCTWRNLGSLATHWVHSEDSDQTGRIPRLIWVFTGRTLILLVLSCCGSY